MVAEDEGVAMTACHALCAWAVARVGLEESAVVLMAATGAGRTSYPALISAPASADARALQPHYGQWNAAPDMLVRLRAVAWLTPNAVAFAGTRTLCATP